MSKILISFLGTGPAQNEGRNKSERLYRNATYRIEGIDYSTSFVADALMQHFKVDKVFLVGTVRSMWERVYEVFASKQNCIDEDYYVRLADCCDAANNQSELALPEKEKIETLLGEGSHIELIKYGLNEEELNYNCEVILGLNKYLKTGDEIIVDITHSFRSLPLYLMNLLIYLQNVSDKNITISHITYGMLDVTTELHYTPVVDLRGLMNFNEWLMGAYAFKDFGKGYKVADLIEQDGNKSVAERLRDFSDVVGLNYSDGIRDQTQKLSALKNEKFAAIPNFIIPSITAGFIKSFPPSLSQAAFEFRIAEWHFNHKNYSSSYLALIEAIITYQCESNGIPWKNKNSREIAKGKVKARKDIVSEKYKELNKIRNCVAHSLDRGDLNSANMISILQKGLQALKPIIGKK